MNNSPPNLPEQREPSEVGAEGTPRVGLPAYSFENAWMVGWAIFKLFYGPLLAATIIVFAVQLICAGIGYGLDQFSRAAGIAFNLVTFPLILVPLQSGGYYFCARAARGERPEIEDCLAGFKNYVAVVVAGLPLCVVSIGGTMLAEVLAASNQGTTPGGGLNPGLVILSSIVILALLVIQIVIGLRLTFAPVIAIDPLWRGQVGERGGDAIGASWMVTSGSAWSLLALEIVAGFMVAGSVLLLCVGPFVLGVPLFYAVYGSAYAMLARPRVDAGKKREPWEVWERR